MELNVLKEPRQNQTHSTFQPIKITLAYDVYTDVMKFRYEIQIWNQTYTKLADWNLPSAQG